MGFPPLSPSQAPHQCLWTLLERRGANTEVFPLLYCRVIWMCIPTLPTHCSCHFWHPLHSVLSSLGPPKLFFLGLEATVLPYSSAELKTKLEWQGEIFSPGPGTPAKEEQTPCTQFSREGFTPGLHLAGYRNSRLVHPWERPEIPASSKVAGVDRACVATLSPSLISVVLRQGATLPEHC